MKWNNTGSLLLYAVTDRACHPGVPLTTAVEAALRGGVGIVQLREKDSTTGERAAFARELLPLCRRYRVPLLLDDDVEAALLSGADGVHVGQSDLALSEARRLLGPARIVGVSAQNVEQALAAERGGADYLGVGAMFPTPTKPDAETVSLETLRSICAAVKIPVVAIGGLNARTLPEFSGSGIVGAAVVSAIFGAPDIEAAARGLRTLAGEVLFPAVGTEEALS